MRTIKTIYVKNNIDIDVEDMRHIMLCPFCKESIHITARNIKKHGGIVNLACRYDSFDAQMYHDEANPKDKEIIRIMEETPLSLAAKRYKDENG